MPGTSSANSSISLALSSTAMLVRPVILPPGRARLAMNPEPTGSPTYCHDNGYGRCCAPDCNHCRRALCDDDIDIAVNKLSHNARVLVECSLRPANVDGQVLPFDVAAPAHTITERAQRGMHQRQACENPDAPDLRLLRDRREWPSRCAADERDELASSHSKTSSARPDRGSGTVMPSALAVFRLIYNSTLVARWTGRSPGFSPLRTRPA